MSGLTDEPTVRTSSTPAAADVKPSETLRMKDGGERRRVPLEELRVRANPRKVYTPESIETLAASIKAYGQIQDCVGWRAPDGKDELIAGTRRLKAFEMLNKQHPDRAEFKTISVTFRDLPEEAIPAIQFIENEEREDLTAVETAEHIMILKNVMKWSDQDIAQKLGWTNKRIVLNYLSIAEAPAWLKMYAVPVAHEVPKKDKQGQVIRSADGTRQTTTLLGSALGATHLHELARFHREMEKQDKKAKAADPEHEPVAQVLTNRIARRCSIEEWSVKRLKEVLERTNRTDGEEGAATADGPKLTHGKTRLNLDVAKLTEPLPKARLLEMKPDIVAVLTRLGYVNVILSAE